MSKPRSGMFLFLRKGYVTVDYRSTTEHELDAIQFPVSDLPAFISQAINHGFYEWQRTNGLIVLIRDEPKRLGDGDTE